VIELENWKKKMKIILLVGILSMFFVNILTQKTITCKVEILQGVTCLFNYVAIGPNETVSIKYEPEDADVNSVTFVQFSLSSIYSILREIFTKFPNAEFLFAGGQNIQEIASDTFADAKKLEYISLSNNLLTFLHKDTFKGPTKLRYIYLDNNFLWALHPRMFSHLTDLDQLLLEGNSCIDKNFYSYSMAEVEDELAACGANYPHP
jgi:hypothetical protein